MVSHGIYKVNKLVSVVCLFLILSAAGAGIFAAVNGSRRSIWLAVALSLLASIGAGWLCRAAFDIFRDINKLQVWARDGREGSVKLSPFGKPLKSAITESIAEISANFEHAELSSKTLALQLQLSERQKHNAQAIIYSIRDAVLVTDEQDRILVANSAAGELLGFSSGDFMHKSITETVNSDCLHFAESVVRSRKARSQHTRCELEFTRSDEKKTYDCVLSSVTDHEKRVCGVVAVLHDMTREKEVSQMKNDFVSHVSHELKTPLASITAYSEMLVDGEADDEETRKEFYGVIQSQAQRLNRLIEDILNVSRIESGLIKVNKEPVSLTILIQDQLDMIRSFADEKDITVTCGRPIVFDRVLADKDMVSQVIINLLSNAIKYTQPGGFVEISTQVDEASSLARVSIKDTGVGIPADEIEHVFDKFYRVASNKKVAKGTGLGLNLVKQIVEKIHGGRVFVESQVGTGSTFSFEMPLATAELTQV